MLGSRGPKRRRGFPQVQLQDGVPIKEHSTWEDVSTFLFTLKMKVVLMDCTHRNKLEMLSLATEDRRTLDLEDVPIRPTKPFFFSKVAAYAGEE